MEKVLYYPYINVPENNWTLRTLLYWDKIGSIIPHSYKNNHSLNPFTERLINKGILERVNPLDIWNFSNYHNSLIEAINNGHNLIENSRVNFHNGSFEKIYIEKFNFNILNNLIELNIAKRESNSDWILVESNVAKFIMTFLASVLSLEYGYQPITDTIDNLDLSFNNLQDKRYLNKVNDGNIILTGNLRSNILENLLPYTIDNDLDKILRFKEKNYSELTLFRKHIERIIFSASLISEESMRERALRMNIEEINEAKIGIVAKMKENKFNNIFFSGSCGLLATATPMIIDPHIMGIPALLYGLYSIYKETNKDKIINPIKYLALTDKKFKINS